MFPLPFLPLVLLSSSLLRVIRPSLDFPGALVRRTIRVGRVPAPVLVLVPVLAPTPRIDALLIPFSALLRAFLLEWTNLREGIPAKICLMRVSIGISEDFPECTHHLELNLPLFCRLFRMFSAIFHWTFFVKHTGCASSSVPAESAL